MGREQSLVDRVREIGATVAARHADAVDADRRFPSETLAALRSAGALGAMIPKHLDGPGATLTEAAGAVTALAAYCGSSALILAMHQIQVACLVRHASEATLAHVLPGLLSGELLLANANSEVGLAGERRKSICALERSGDGYRLEKRASTVSYGEYADGVLATARRSADSPPNQQVFAICLAPHFTLEPSGDWDTVGMRGTCSRPALLQAELPESLVIDNYQEIFLRTSLGASAVLLSSVWLGIAEEAARRAHASVRAGARAQPSPHPDAPPPTRAIRLAELGVVLHQLREVVAGGAAAWERVKDTDEVTEFSFTSRMDNLKVASSTLAGDVVAAALQICGLGGYKNGEPYSLGRLSRDVGAAPIMVNNDRSLDAMARTLLIRKAL